MNREQIIAILKPEIEAIEPLEVQHKLSLDLVSPYDEQRQSDQGLIPIWVVARPDWPDAAIVYGEMPYPETERHWGLVSLSSKFLGTSGAWYDSLKELVEDCGYY